MSYRREEENLPLLPLKELHREYDWHSKIKQDPETSLDTLCYDQIRKALAQRDEECNEERCHRYVVPSHMKNDGPFAKIVDSSSS